MKKLLIISFLGILVLALLPKTRAQQPGEDRLRLKDVFDLEFASDPQIAPDGKRVVYVRNYMDIMKDRRRSQLWIVNVDGSDRRPLSTGERDDSSPRWSPDGKRLLFVSAADKSAQIYCRWMDSGQTAQITRTNFTPQNPVWSPDGKSIAFVMHVPEKVKPFVDLPAKPAGAQWADPPKIIRKVSYRYDGKGYLKDGYDHLFVVPAEGGTARQLTHGSFYHDEPVWTPDGRALVFSANRHPNWELEPVGSEIFEISIAGGKIQQLTKGGGPHRQPAVSPDGRHIAYAGFVDKQQGYQVTNLYLMNRDGSESRRLLPDFDRDVRRPIWSKDGTSLFFQYDDLGDAKVAQVNLNNEMRTVASHVGGTVLDRPYASGSFSRSDDGTVAFTISNAERPADVAVTRAPVPARVTDLNANLLGHKALGKIEEIWYKSAHDGRKVQGWILKPPGFNPGKKYPLLLEIHGGPFANYGPHFSADMQLYAAKGYVVFYANPRGSTGYGQEFGNLIHHNYPGNDYDDLMSGVDAVVARGYIDDKNLFVTGGSGGGVLSAWIVGKTNRFRAAVVVKPVINWYSFALTADAYPFFWRYWFPGYPWEHAEHYLKRSPISLVGHVTTPTMVMTGESDYRTPISESEQFYQALKLRGVDTALVRVPGASHNIAARPSQLIASVACVLRWFETHRADSDANALSGTRSGTSAR